MNLIFDENNFLNNIKYRFKWNCVEKIISGFRHRYYSTCTARKGYSGTAIWSKIKPLNVIYGINKTVYLDRPLSKNDILMDHPWNTYKILGLPPTPICNVGIDSIKAVLNPEKTDYLYFVADGNGGQHFSNTYEEHLKFIKIIREK